MDKRKTLKVLITAFCLIVLSLFFSSVSDSAEYVIPKKFTTPPPPFTPGIFPCSQCHQGMPADKKPRKLEQMHQEITLRHMPDGWCFDCHNADNRDKLRLANGKLISFGESYYLCGQCHGTVLRDWKAGLHGKRTGQWNGEKEYRLCVHCHWPHEPAFKPLTPMPPPVKPSDIK
ncbi:MAG: hypothetical protein AABY42_03780 [Nitrospirota bacterium]